VSFDSDDRLLPISALQHLLFCERQCALIHLEGLWAENRRTTEGRHLHDNAHDGPDETRAGVRLVRAMPLRSERLGLFGVADVVEFHASGTPLPDLTTLPGLPPHPASPPVGRPYPVEYKRGRTKTADCDRVQLCAQALCLEEMLAVTIPEGALFYGQTRRRERVLFDPVLRVITESATRRLHELIASRRTPRAIRESKCDQCSLLQLCLPDALAPTRTASAYFDKALRSMTSDYPPRTPP